MLPYTAQELSSIQKLSPAEFNTLVTEYKHGNLQRLEDILLQFHPLIHKYIRLIKGQFSPALLNFDTVQFLSLFLPRQDKTPISHRSIIRQLGEATSFLEEEDLYNDIVVLLLECIHEYQEGNGSALGYISTRLRWKLRNWLVWQVMNRPYDCCNSHRLDNQLNWEVYDSQAYPAAYEPKLYEGLSEMDLHWVQRTNDPVFKELSVYERYLLYLYWKEGLTFEEMAKILRRDKDTIHRHYTSLMQELSEICNHNA